ncbi:F-actin-uncapping protein LRRC16A isoform X10 [Aedes albopictus]|uniref:CARMIL C-terminal domain-containing protein n=1 Tax=Aedes albopictus TaxID=7160 RepID=A0ABM1YRG9_AEDAL
MADARLGIDALLLGDRKEQAVFLQTTVDDESVSKLIEVNPIERATIFSDEIRPSDPRNVGPCGGFSMQYACMCDFHAVQYREEVAWDIDTIYLSHDNRILNLRDFDHLEQKDLTAIVSALEYNTFFRGLKITNTRLSIETLERILHVLKRSMWLEELHLEALGLRSDFIHKLSIAVISNPNPALRSIDLSHNMIEDKGAGHFAGPIAKISKGVSKLSLSHCGLTSKGVNQIAQSLSLNQNVSNSLVFLDLSGNNLKDDVNNLYNFLAQPNVIEYLDISRTDTTLESLFGALLRGCSTHLLHLNVAHNSFNTKKGKEIPPSFKQFFTSSLNLKHLNISNCKLPLEALKHLLLGFACNESTAGLYLDLSCNSLSSQGAHVLESCIHGVRVLSSLDISDNNLDLEMASVLTAIGKNPSIKVLHMSKCFNGMKIKHISTVMEALVNLIQKDDFQLQELVLSENKLKNDLHNFINALGSNQSLQMLDITGNLMGDIGARLLAKALQINNRLKTICMDRNSITLQGYADIVYALEHNFSMRNIPFPVFDITPCLKQHPERTDTLMRKMQELLSRNGDGSRRGNGQGFRLQHGFLLSATHQILEKLVTETQEEMSLRQGGENNLTKLLQDAENCKQLLPKLQDAVRCDPHHIEVRLSKLKLELHSAIKHYLKDYHAVDQFETRGLDLPKLGLDSPTKLEYLNLATPQLQSKRRSIARKVRPQSVVGLGIENLSLSNLPDMLKNPSPERHYSRSKLGSTNEQKDEECCDSISELPSQSMTLQHLVKGRPKRAKTRASKKTAAIHIADPSTVNEGIEEFFRPASTTPSTLTPLVSPTSEDCSLLSFADSPTLSRGDGSRFSNVTSEETTPILEERRIIKLERSSPVMKNVNWSSRSRSSDNLEKVSPSINEKSPTSNYIENAKEMPDAYPATINSKDMGKHKSPSNESVKSQHSELQRPGNDIIKTPVPAQKPRPWSVLGHESKNDFETNDATAMTPDDINDGMDLVLISGQTPGGSIVGITPGAIGGGSIVGITPGAVMEKKSVRDMAANLNKLGGAPSSCGVFGQYRLPGSHRRVFDIFLTVLLVVLYLSGYTIGPEVCCRSCVPREVLVVAVCF